MLRVDKLIWICSEFTVKYLNGSQLSQIREYNLQQLALQFKSQGMSQVVSPFLEELKKYKNKSRTIRKKIYKFMMSKHYKKEDIQTTSSLQNVIEDRQLPMLLKKAMKGNKLNSLADLQKLEVDRSFTLENVKELATRQELEVRELAKQQNFTYSTAKKRRVLCDITGLQSADRHKMMFSTANQQESSFSLSKSDLSFSSLNDFQVLEGRESRAEDLQFFKPRQITSFILENHHSATSNQSPSIFADSFDGIQLEIID